MLRTLRATCCLRHHWSSGTYSYSQAEEHFYQMLTSFIVSGKAYASDLSSADSRAVILVLIAVQKLASNCVAAIRRALKKRLATFQSLRQSLETANTKSASTQKSWVAAYKEADTTSDLDQISDLEEEMVADWNGLRTHERRGREAPRAY